MFSMMPDTLMRLPPRMRTTRSRRSRIPMLDLTLNVKQQITKNDALRFAVYNLLDRDDIRTGSSSGTGAMLEERNWMLSYEHSF